mmetsp:Transcript_30273/g.35973  ORF Transcript_30273/g.35973 Transcript_30273/m.35973 type:complete len:96 (+) Transcript_30273:548-835(+)
MQYRSIHSVHWERAQGRIRCGTKDVCFDNSTQIHTNTKRTPTSALSDQNGIDGTSDVIAAPRGTMKRPIIMQTEVTCAVNVWANKKSLTMGIACV